MAANPIVAIVSPQLRRDLHDPLRFFSRLTVHHFYHEALGDVGADDWHGREHRYAGAYDLLRQLRELRPALVQGCEPTWFPPSLPVCLATAQLAVAGVPLFFPVLENRPLAEKFGAVGGKLMAGYLRWYAARAQLVYAVNAGAAQLLRDAGVPAAKVRQRLYGTWGVDLREFSPTCAQRSDYILFVGRLEEEKGIHYLLEAFARVRRELPHLRLLLAGDGPLRDVIARFRARHALADAVVLLGMLPNREMPGLFQNALATCVPSITMRGWAEQVGMANLQSMACGTPVVATRSGAIAEMVGDAGLLVPERDSSALAEALLQVLTEKEVAADLSRRGRARAEERFDARANITGIENEIIGLCADVHNPCATKV